MSRDQLQRLKELEAENTRLRRVVSDLTLDKNDPGRGCTG
jgi:putative transposase